MVKGRNFKDAYPAEAQALETELAQLLAKRETRETFGVKNYWTDIQRARNRKENPERSEFTIVFSNSPFSSQAHTAICQDESS